MKEKIIVKRVVSAVIVCILVMIAYIASSHGNAETVKELQIRTVEKIIEDLDISMNKIVERDSMLNVSTNPYDLTEGNEYFDELVERGVYAVPAMMQSLKQAQYDDMTEYLIAIAIEAITETDLKETDYHWEDAKGFVEQFQQVSDDRIEIVKQALDKQQTGDSLSKELEPYGVIGMEALQEIKQDDILHKKYRKKLEALDDYVTISDKECNYMKESFLE